MAAKKCSKCGVEKPLDQFYRRKDSKDGYGQWCKACMDAKREARLRANWDQEIASRREWRRRNPDKVRAIYKRKSTKPGYKEKESVRGAKWYAENSERLKAVRREWYLKNKPEHNARSLASYYADKASWRARANEWAQKHPERMRAMMASSDARRRAAKMASPGQFSESDVQEIFAWQRGRCAVCTEKLTKSFHRDHIVPLKRGGANDRRNIQLLCKSCNSQKSAKDPIAHMQERGFLL